MKFDWKASLGLDPAKNPYLRLSEADRMKVGIRVVLVTVIAMALFTLLRWLGLRTG